VCTALDLKTPLRGNADSPSDGLRPSSAQRSIVEEIARGRRRPTLPLHELGEPIGSGTTPAAENVQRESSPVVCCGTDQQISEGFRIALQIMGLGTTFLPVGIALAANAPNTEDN
jgi:hypothetical protein